MQPINPTLEAEYNNRAMVPEHPAIFERWRRDSAQLRLTAPCTLDIAYGEAPLNKLDLFHAKDSRGTVVFIHGGYWRSLDKSDFSFVAKPFIDAGLDVAVINYRLCPSVRISEIAGDCRQALAWIIDNGGAHNVSVERIALAGHSAGAHLVAMLYATDWAQLRCDVSKVIGGIALSGVYDLEPLLQCSMNADLHLNHHSARAESPIKLVPTLAVPLHLAVGADESPAFHAQSRLLAAAWPDICDTPEEVADANHFTVLDHFAQQTQQTCLRVLRHFS
jgi:arylformamidase